MAEPVFVDSPLSGHSLDDLWDLIKRPSWQAKAACRGKAQSAFFAERGQPVDEARAICAGCSVIAQCREFSRTERFGIWAGLSERERRRERREAA